MGSGFAKKKKQQKAIQEQFSKLQEQMQNTEFTGSAGNGLVEIVMNGEKELKGIKINPDCVDPKDVEGLQDLIVEAFRDASQKMEEKTGSAAFDPMSLFS
jgi:DNA-binding YbaB/EbfC family protein